MLTLHKLGVTFLLARRVCRCAAMLGLVTLAMGPASAQRPGASPLNLDLTQRAPDLVIVSAAQRGSRSRDGEYLVVPLIVTIKNIGTANTNAPFKIGVSYATGNGRTPLDRLVFRPASSLLRGDHVVRIRMMNQGQTTQIIGKVRIRDPQKKVSSARVAYLKAKVDAGTQSATGAVAETNERNNWSPVAHRVWNP